MINLTRGERFRDARTVYNAHGSQTMAEVYSATGISASKIADLENDDKDRGVDYREVGKLAKHYGVSVDWLLGLSDVTLPDADLRGVCEYTGLSEGAVDVIKHLGFILLKEGYCEAMRGYHHAIMQTLNLLFESDEFVDIMLNLQHSRGVYHLTADPEVKGIDLINAEDMAYKVGFVILDRLDAAEHYAQKASLALHEFSTKTLRQFAEAEKEADNGEHTEN